MTAKISSILRPRRGQLSLGKKDSKDAMEVWGLTGGIASGKSTAARFFSELGLPVLDADQISRDLSAPGGAAFDAIQKRFATADRAKIREIVFSDTEARRDLEAILHPLIQAETMKRTQALSGAPVVIYEASLLVETGRHKSFAGLIVVHAPREVRKARLMHRNGHSQELAERILNAQTSDEERLQAATVVIENGGSEAELKTRISELCKKMGWIA